MGIAKVKMRWNPCCERWVVLHPVTDANWFELPDCQNFRDLFDALDKGDSCSYILTAEKD